MGRKPTNTNQRLLEILESKTMKEGGEWLWQGSCSDDGYGQIRFQGKYVKVHRASAYLFLGLDLNSERQVLHGLCCTHRNCWNPEHLKLGDHKENMKDKYITITHCKRGHEFTEENTYMTKEGKRHCRACGRMRHGYE